MVTVQNLTLFSNEYYTKLMKKWDRMCEIENIHDESQCHFLKIVNFVNMRRLIPYSITVIYIRLSVVFVEGNSSLTGQVFSYSSYWREDAQILLIFQWEMPDFAKY